ncbi:hypothetical protein [Agrobacterium vitis]|uniref:Uncharacterized protein n=1 Tax=Agrobacterium vitis TaxID=373 RepID=A0AAE2UXC6_AGRVI|nr:hypothetical protein [Agrobacterium vitis]MBF2717680.1 hypothetical protein [Agrobacterium vitis]MVA22620.1 hypothetical protein [Agrobacterium vitis]
MVVVDERLSRGLVRAETRGLTDALNRHAGDVLKTFYDGVIPHFEKHNRLTLLGMQAIADDLDKKARAAFSPLWCDTELLPPTRGRPQSGSYEMLHYWINPKPVDGNSSRLMMIAMFSAWGTRKQIALRAHDTLTSFYEHAAQRLLQRCGSREAAVRAIGQRLVETIIIPTLALHEAPQSLADTEFPIPFMNGLLLGRFIRRSTEKIDGESRMIGRGGWGRRPVNLQASLEFVVKTYIGPEEIKQDQELIARRIEEWLAAHQGEAETIRRYIGYKLGTLWDNGHISRQDFDGLREDFWKLHSEITAVQEGLR